MKRQTYETDIIVKRTEDEIIVETKDLVLNHMLNSLFFYMEFPVEIKAESDLRHHLWEDCGIAIGEFLAQQFDRNSIARFGQLIMPMDEALILVCLDLSRTFVCLELDIKEPEQGFQQGLFREFVNGLARSLNLCVHIRQMAGLNAHHIIEAAFKGLGKAFKQAFEPSNRLESTKGVI